MVAAAAAMSMTATDGGDGDGNRWRPRRLPLLGSWWRCVLLQRNNQNIRGAEIVIILGKMGRKIEMTTTIIFGKCTWFVSVNKP
jgi:hypothetical protein